MIVNIVKYTDIICTFHKRRDRDIKSYIPRQSPGEDRIHGQGVAVFASGNRYEGTWENGRIHGHGAMTNF